MTEIRIPPVNAIKQVVDLLDELGIDPLHLHADGAKVLDARHDIKLWLRYRTDFERVCAALKAKPVERPHRGHGQREWYAEPDTADRRLLVQCVSFEHHPDWEAREAS